MDGYKYIVQDEGYCGGKPRIAGSRMAVQFIAIEYEYQHWSADDMCDAHPGLTLAEVHAALAYYYDHKLEIDEKIREGERFYRRMKAKQDRERQEKGGSA